MEGRLRGLTRIRVWIYKVLGPLVVLPSHPCAVSRLPNHLNLRTCSFLARCAGSLQHCSQLELQQESLRADLDHLLCSCWICAENPSRHNPQDSKVRVMAASQYLTPSSSGPSFEDTQDFTDADRGFIGSLKPCIIRNARGKTIWDNDVYDFVYQQKCPPTVNAGLWRQAQLLSKQGLYQISQTIYQIRGFDISHVTFVEGRSGVVIVDPLISCECASAALKFYENHRGSRPVRGVVYTHSHIDHYGGAAGLFPGLENDAVPEGVAVVAPEGFMEEALSENVIAGPIMRHRAAHMYGSRLERSPCGQVGVGLGMASSTGRTSLIPPTAIIKQTGERLTIDGVTMVFQMVPDTEAPSEFNIYFPDDKALLIPECAGHALHNITTLRGALVRDAKAWARYLDESLVLFCEIETTDVLFGSHSWPTWGSNNIRRYLGEQRDLYAYLHDQTIRQMNRGLNGTEIAETFVLPPNLRRRWHTQGFYGSINHNVKGIYQRYMTWFDGRAENLWRWPPKEEGSRYVTCMGGPQETLRKASQFQADGDLRFAATLLGNLVAAREEYPQNVRSQSREMLAQVFESLGFGCENTLWRNFYLTQSKELRHGDHQRSQFSPLQASFPPQMSVEQWFEGLSVSIDGAKAGEEGQTMQIGVDVVDKKESWVLILSNGALTYRNVTGTSPLTQVPGHDLVLEIEMSKLREILTGKGDPNRLQILTGDIVCLERLLSLAGLGKIVRSARI